MRIFSMCLHPTPLVNLVSCKRYTLFRVDGWWMLDPTHLPCYTISDSDAGLSEMGNVLKLRQIAI